MCDFCGLYIIHCKPEVLVIDDLFQPGLRSIWEKYYEEAHAVVFVIDAACPSRFEDSKTALGKLYGTFE